jgi:Tol biopolymer transport system component
MAGPMTERRPVAPRDAPVGPTPPELLPEAVRRAVTEIAGAPGAWCPALSPEGDRVAYVTDRSGIPRLEVARLDGATPLVLSGPAEEVVSVAWSPDGGRLAYLVSPGGSICAELHVVRPDGSGHRVIAGEDPRATVFAGGWTGPGHYVCSIAPGDGPDADIVLVDAATGGHRTLAVGGFLSVTSVSVDERFVLARRGPRGYRHIVVIDVATGVQRRALGLDAPGGIASEDGRFGPDGRSLYVRASLPGAPFTDRAGLVAVPLSEDGVPGEGRVVLSRPDADLDGYALRTDGTVLAVWSVDGVTELLVHAASDGAVVRQIALPEPVLPGWSLSADGATMIAELTGPRAPRGLWVVPITGPAAPALVPSAPGRPDPALLVTPVRYEYAAADGLPLSGWLYTPRGV